MKSKIGVLALGMVMVMTALLLAAGLQSTVKSERREDFEVYTIFCANGECSHNRVTDGAKDIVRAVLNSGSANISFIALGNLTTTGDASTDLSSRLTGCGFAIAGCEGMLTSGLNWANYSCEKVFTSTCDGVVINSVGLYNSSVAGKLFSFGNISENTYDSGSQLNITVGIIVNSSSGFTNYVTNITALALTGGSANLNYLGVGNATTAAQNDTALPEIQTGCGFTAGACTYNANAPSGNWSCYKQWTSSCDNVLIKSFGLYNTSASGKMLAFGNLTQNTFNSGSKLAVNVTIWVGQ